MADTPEWMLGDDPVKARLRGSYSRIDCQVAANVREQKERRKALAWCRANGNPHLHDQ